MEQRGKNIIKLARYAIEEMVKMQIKPDLPDWLPDYLLKEKAGVFVSLKIAGKLRGCMGSLRPSRSCLAQEIIDLAIEAAINDPRFFPVTLEELPLLSYSVDVLRPPENIDDKRLLDPQRYGLIVGAGHRRGVLLPRLEGIDAIDDQLHIALDKAGISPRENYHISRFEVIRYVECEDE